jgi:hypothetical protein
MSAFNDAVWTMKVGDYVAVPSPIPIGKFENIDLRLLSDAPKEFDMYCGGIRFGGLKQQENGTWRFIRI